MEYPYNYKVPVVFLSFAHTTLKSLEFRSRAVRSFHNRHKQGEFVVTALRLREYYPAYKHTRASREKPSVCLVDTAADSSPSPSRRHDSTDCLTPHSVVGGWTPSPPTLTPGIDIGAQINKVNCNAV